jgi:hypothetical protein
MRFFISEHLPLLNFDLLMIVAGWNIAGEDCSGRLFPGEFAMN